MNFDEILTKVKNFIKTTLLNTNEYLGFLFIAVFLIILAIIAFIIIKNR